MKGDARDSSRDGKFLRGSADYPADLRLAYFGCYISPCYTVYCLVLFYDWISGILFTAGSAKQAVRRLCCRMRAQEARLFATARPLEMGLGFRVYRI